MIIPILKRLVTEINTMFSAGHEYWAAWYKKPLRCAKCHRLTRSGSATYKVRMFHAPEIFVTVQTERGRITEISKDADRKGDVEISTNVKHLAGKANANTLVLEEF